MFFFCETRKKHVNVSHVYGADNSLSLKNANLSHNNKISNRM